MINKKEILFALGDVGAGNLALALKPALEANNCNLTFVLDNSGKAKDLFERGEGVEGVFVAGHADLIERQTIEKANLVVIGMSATATRLESSLLLRALNMGKDVAILSDGPYNINLPCWRKLGGEFRNHKRAHFFAINGAHVRFAWHVWSSLIDGNFHILGQPAFDKAISMIPEKHKIRRRVRRSLGIQGKTVLVWFAEGMKEAAPEDFLLFKHAMQSMANLRKKGLRNFQKLTVIPALHPKLNDELSMGAGYTDRILAEIESLGRYLDIEVLHRPHKDICCEEELAIAADIIASPLGTSAAKAEVMGMRWPVILHWSGPEICNWYQNYFGIDDPKNLIDVAAGRALFIKEFMPIMDTALQQAMSDHTARRLLKSWKQPPLEPAAMRIVAKMLQIMDLPHRNN